MGLRSQQPLNQPDEIRDDIRLVPPTRHPSRPAGGVDWSWVAVLLVAALSALGAFALVRWRGASSYAADARPATLTVGVQPDSAELFIDGRARGATPVTLPVEPGAHTLTLRVPGAERTVPLTVAAGAQVAQYFELKPVQPVMPTARLSVATDPPGALVSVDGQPRGVSPLVVDDLAAAEHGVTVTSKIGSAARKVTIEPGKTTEVVFALRRTPAPVGGWLSVASPFQVEVLDHDEVVGTSGTKMMLAAGRHDVVIRNGSVGYEARRSVDVVAGSVATIEVVPPKAALNVNARPWADVLIDGAAVGQTPLGNIMIPVGTHEITFRHPQLGERTQTVVVSATGVNRVAVDLTR
jgi:PEGA domain